MNKNSKIGQIGENLAENYLKRKSYQILLKNYRKKFGEIDIVARAPDAKLSFVEVKTLSIEGENLFIPEDNFTTQKIRNVKRMAEFFAARYPELIDEEKGWQIDLITVEIFEHDSSFSIRHYENI